ncbi:MAG: diguanylate cyclase [Candidatus Ferrigenium altingense]
MNKSNPSELARETLKTLAARKMPPTPDNYSRIYAEISGTPADGDRSAAKVLRGIAEHLAQTPQSAPAGMALKKVIGAEDWDQCLKEIEKILPKPGGESTLSWSDLIRDLLRQLETPHKGLTVTRKKEGLETVLKRFAVNPEALHDKLNGLIRSWAVSPVAASTEIDSISPATPAASGAMTVVPASAATAHHMPGEEAGMPARLAELLAQTLQGILGALPELTQEVQALVQQVRDIKTPEQLAAFARQLRPFLIKAELRAGDNAKVHEGLVRLLRLLVENVGEMVEDEDWLHGQVAILQEIIAKPIDRHAIADAERGLRDAIIKQGMLKQSLSELSHLLEDIMQDTRVIQSSALRSHEELVGTRKQVQEAEAKIRKLELELAQVSELVHQDQLTGALNRHGLDEAFEREATRADRSHTPVCVALLDIDNFKRLNDTMGHQAGDQALVHLSQVIKEALRPSDAVARYGGEEFIIVLPGIGLEEATATVERLQRELTKKFFLHENDRVLITFSAGVALRAPQEPQDDVIGRADRAMYQAKKTGKNRVVVAE